MNGPHILLALSPHGYGHGAMTAPIVQEIRRRIPGLKLTIQTSLDPGWLRSRYPLPFDYVGEIPDFGLAMHDANTVDAAASEARYRQLFAALDSIVLAEMKRLEGLGLDLVLANIPFVTIIAAKRLGLPVVALSSLNWADILQAYSPPSMMAVIENIRRAYASADCFLRLEPALPTAWLPDAIAVGPVARQGTRKRDELMTSLGLDRHKRLGLLAFGGMDPGFDPARIAPHPDWHWVLGQGRNPGRTDMTDLARIDFDFTDLVASVDAAVTKPGYGMFTEAAVNGCPLLHLDRPDWPETPYLAEWIGRYVANAAIPRGALFDGRLVEGLERLLAEPKQMTAVPSGAAEASDHILAVLRTCRLAVPDEPDLI